MHITMLKRRSVSPNGYTQILLEAGGRYDLSDDLGQSLVKQGAAEAYTPTAAELAELEAGANAPAETLDDVVPPISNEIVPPQMMKMPARAPVAPPVSLNKPTPPPLPVVLRPRLDDPPEDPKKPTRAQRRKPVKAGNDA